MSKGPSVIALFASVDEFTAKVQQFVYHSTDLSDAEKDAVKDAVVQAHTAIRLLRINRDGGKT